MNSVPKKKSNKEYNVPALEKAFNLFDMLIAFNKPVSLSRLANELNEKPSGIFRVLNTMVLRGYITRNVDSGLYSISPLGKFIAPAEHLKLVAIPLIDNFMHVAPFSCHLSILSGFSQVVIYNGMSQINYLQITVSKGRVINAVETYTGLLMLSRLSEKKRHTFFRKLKQEESKKKLMLEEIENFKTRRTITFQSLIIDGVLDVISIGPENTKGLIWGVSCPIIKKFIREDELHSSVIQEIEALVDAISQKFN